MATRTAVLTHPRTRTGPAAGFRRLLAALLAALALGTASSPLAAPPATDTLPLFRHALEQWSPGHYEVFLLHHGELSPEDQDHRQALEEAQRRFRANANFRAIDLEGTVAPSLSSLWSGQDPPATPWVLVRAPGPGTDTPAVWAGPLRAPLLEHLFDSPARTRIAEGLLQGATAMWVLLECGEAARDEAAVDTLTSSLRALEKELKTPARGKPRSPLPLRVDFGLVRVTRNDLAEEFLVHLLERGNPAVSTRPLAFAVFGRGRLLGPLAGRELDREGIRGVCQLLLSPPAAGNAPRPGRDLLLGTDWNRIFKPMPAVQAPGKPAGPASPEAPGGPEGALPIWTQLAAGAVLATAAGAVLRARRRRRP